MGLMDKSHGVVARVVVNDNHLAVDTSQRTLKTVETLQQIVADIVTYYYYT